MKPPEGTLYRFSPIEDEKTLNNVLAYLVVELDKLAQTVFKKSLAITTLKVFPHYLDEYDYLRSIISSLGDPAPFNSKTSFYVGVARKIEGHEIKYLGVRVVDPYRLQVGCGDYEVEDFEQFKIEYLNSSPFIRSFREDMIEIWHPDFDILGYVVKKSTD
jgi:hypothetical protein